MGEVNPKASEVMTRSMGRPVPANAHAPKGQKFSLALQSSNRPASRSSYKTTLWPSLLKSKKKEEVQLSKCFNSYDYASNNVISKLCDYDNMGSKGFQAYEVHVYGKHQRVSIK